MTTSTTLPLELVLNIAHHAPLSTLASLHKTCYTLHAHLPSPQSVLQQHFDRLLRTSKTIHEALGRALVDNTWEPGPRRTLLKLLVQHGGQWERAFAHLWHADKALLIQFGGSMHSIQEIHLWDLQTRTLKGVCSEFAEIKDVDMVKSFVPALGLFEVAALTGLPELVKEASEMWREWRE
ncbi:uncharacterized protein SPPG_02864 [Spizellomyces punctatus DAOM BR117]|uniref:F-box domain-containing protein n=1 Tax=Spizellomyces punctatus (strain DAOM BR117) TaxID=645134 RepID=A0A0L0HMS4_SPIPD|nr:uncharacterized protein SPPG_02864 [Spizellomyces punctatus DAOM BR117]KND02397.1 hypothetical protein SPPG_02864 [Spizellomyces punctatus DAOM BR117]|eukprot:XP_016610436.1 hypothetical protein SPPG_02864 [Spizellomyces punctatus DAOM BR117]